MSSAQTRFDMLKLSLSRLNEDWSPTGETFCHQAAMHIRQAVWDDNDIYSPLHQLMLAIAHMVKRYSQHVDADTMPAQGVGLDVAIDGWNNTFTAASYIMDELESFLTQKQRDELAQQTIQTYKRLF
jgi:hypothetical protein